MSKVLVSLSLRYPITAKEGSLEIRKFLAEPPRTDEALAQLRRELFGNPFYVGKFISADAKATALYVPIQDLLMWFLFRRWTLLVPAMLLMMISVTWTMGAMIRLLPMSAGAKSQIHQP